MLASDDSPAARSAEEWLARVRWAREGDPAEALLDAIQPGGWR
jgi:hypothetical protein